MKPPLPRDELKALAGSGAFGRGLDYFENGHVTLDGGGRDRIEATVLGTSIYGLWIQREGKILDWFCDCPAAEDGSFCKHLVAAALADAARDDQPSEPVKKRTTGRKRRKASSGPARRKGARDDRPPKRATKGRTGRKRRKSPAAPAPAETPLLELLERQPAADLARWLAEAAYHDETLEQRLRFELSPRDLATVKALIRELINSSGFLDYRRSMDYATQIAPVAEVLGEMLETDPTAALELADEALSRLIRIYGRSDDSSGSIGEEMQRIADVHRRAAKACAPLGAAFARRLHSLKTREEWDVFPLARYWPLLDAEGQRAYRHKLEAEVEALPERRTGDRNASGAAYVSEFSVLNRREELARMEGDFDTLAAVVQRDMGEWYGYRKMVELCHEFQRPAEAAAWAERGLRALPDSALMRDLAADERLKAGLNEAAAELLWANFEARPAVEAWKRLKKAAGEDWPRWRQRGLVRVARAEPEHDGERRDVSLRIRLLIADGDIATARALGLRQMADASALHSLAHRLRKTDPVAAASFLRMAVDLDLVKAVTHTYTDHIPDMKAVVALDPGPETEAWLAGLRQRYRARRKLIGLMDAAGLGGG